MPEAARSISVHKAIGVYAGTQGFSQRSSMRRFQQRVIADTVQISKEALGMAKQMDKDAKTDRRPGFGDLGEQELTLEQIRKIFIAAIKKNHPDNFSDLPDEIREKATKKTAQIIEVYRSIQKILS